MPESTGFTGRGVAFQIGQGNGPPETFVSVANATDITINGREVDEVDFTHLASEGGYREFRPGFKDAGEVSLTVQFDPSQVTLFGVRGIQTLFDSNTLFNWRIDFTGAGRNFAFSGRGYVSNPGDLSANVDDPIELDITLRCTGVIALIAV